MQGLQPLARQAAALAADLHAARQQQDRLAAELRQRDAALEALRADLQAQLARHREQESEWLRDMARREMEARGRGWRGTASGSASRFVLHTLCAGRRVEVATWFL